jgi:hypothetical protein
MALKGAAQTASEPAPAWPAAVPVCTSEAVARFADGAEPTFGSRTRAVVAAHQDS